MLARWVHQSYKTHSMASRSVRAPYADLPNVAAFLGGLVAQEAIKMITKQYVPVNGYCVADLIETWTGTLTL
jgi:NEDD8-activating enzyme E1 regulatory subunit